MDKHGVDNCYSLLELCRSVLLEGCGHGDGRDDGHGVPLLRLLSGVGALRPEVGVAGTEAGHLVARSGVSSTAMESENDGCCGLK